MSELKTHYQKRINKIKRLLISVTNKFDRKEIVDELFANSEEDVPTSSRTAEMKTYIRNSMKVEHTIERLESIARGEASNEVKKEQNTKKEPKGGDNAPKS